jgi:transglutaminase-like putative cysteine protease
MTPFAPILWAALLPAAPPAYALEAVPSKTIDGVYVFEAHVPKLAAQEWVIYAAKPPELPSQTKVSISVEPKARPIEELSPLHRTVLFGLVPGRSGHDLTVTVRYHATLIRRDLLAGRGPGAKAPDLSPAERRAALGAGGLIDFESKAFQSWLDAERLRRRADEGDVDLARRVFQAIRKGTRYEYRDVMERHASRTCRAGKTDCGGMAILFTAAVRANDIPARVLAGRWAESAKVGDKIGGSAYSQYHVKAEFFARGAGWVPVDLSSAVLHDKTEKGLQFFGHDLGDFLTVHVNPDLVLDSVHFGRKDADWLQGVNFWVTGNGILDGQTSREDWKVTTKP